jgi:hypothetical protein
MKETKTKLTHSGSETRKRQGVIKLRVDVVEKAEIQKRADLAGLSIAGLLRKLIFGNHSKLPKAARRPTGDLVMLARLKFAMRRIGGYLQLIETQMGQTQDFDANVFKGIYSEIHAVLEVISSAIRHHTTEQKSYASSIGMPDTDFDSKEDTQ